MPIQKETTLNTRATMPRIGLGTILHVSSCSGTLISFLLLDLFRDVEVGTRGSRDRSRART